MWQRFKIQALSISADKNSPKNAGAALLVVLVSIMLITIMLFEFQYRTRVEQKLAYNDLDQLRAYYLAKSGARLGVLRVALYGRSLNSQIAKQAQKYNAQQYLDAIWDLPFPAFPPDVGLVNELIGSEKSDAEKMLEQTKIEDGQFSTAVLSESSKINLNYLVIPKNRKEERIDFSEEPKGLFDFIGRMLFNLVEGFITQSEDPYAEFGNLNPEELVFNLMDWVNPGDERLSGGFKDGWYEKQDPPYRAKRNRFYTVDELRMVRGMDENLLKKLRPHVTVHSYGAQINLNSAKRDLFKALYPDFTEDDLDAIIQDRNEKEGWSSVNQFITFVKERLNRPEFEDYYPQNADSPFTVQNHSFVVESLGVIKKSASQVQRSIKVAVALVTEDKGGQVVPNVRSPSQCTGKNVFLDKRFNQCKYKPKNEEQCDFLAAEWREDNGQFCCFILKPPQKICPATSTGTGTGAGAAAGGKSEPEPPNAVKILSWVET